MHATETSLAKMLVCYVSYLSQLKRSLEDYQPLYLCFQSHPYNLL